MQVEGYNLLAGFRLRNNQAARVNDCAGAIEFPFRCLKNWSERGDLNSRPPVPQGGAFRSSNFLNPALHR